MVRDVGPNDAGGGESHWGERESVIRQRTDAVKQKLISLAAVINIDMLGNGNISHGQHRSGYESRAALFPSLGAAISLPFW
jgi:hypothetical protein